VLVEPEGTCTIVITVPAAALPCGPVIFPDTDEEVSCAIAVVDKPTDNAIATATRFNFIEAVIKFSCVF
jgi:hypothetical protein